MPIFAYTCNLCNTYKEEITNFTDSEKPRHCKCGLRMIKIPGTSVFNIRGFNEQNGYSTINTGN